MKFLCRECERGPCVLMTKSDPVTPEDTEAKLTDCPFTNKTALWKVMV